MVLLIIIPIKWLFHWEYTLFSDKPTCLHNGSTIFGRISERTSSGMLPAHRKYLEGV